METKNEQKLEEQFKGNQNLQNEFGGDFEAFVAFAKADQAGRIRICTPGTCGRMSVEDFNNSEELGKLLARKSKIENELKRLSGMQKKSADEEAG